jgi:hypothetical protein
LLIEAIPVQVPIATNPQDLIPNECPITTRMRQNVPSAQFGNLTQANLLVTNAGHANSKHTPDGYKVVPSTQFQHCSCCGHPSAYAGFFGQATRTDVANRNVSAKCSGRITTAEQLESSDSSRHQGA